MCRREGGRQRALEAFSSRKRKHIPIGLLAEADALPQHSVYIRFDSASGPSLEAATICHEESVLLRPPRKTLTLLVRRCRTAHSNCATSYYDASSHSTKKVQSITICNYMYVLELSGPSPNQEIELRQAQMPETRAAGLKRRHFAKGIPEDRVLCRCSTYLLNKRLAAALEKLDNAAFVSD